MFNYQMLCTVVILSLVASCGEAVDTPSDPIDYTVYEWVQKYKLNNFRKKSETHHYPYMVFRDDTVDLYRTHIDSSGPSISFEIIHIGGEGIKDFFGKTVSSDGVYSFSTSGNDGTNKNPVYFSTYDSELGDNYDAVYVAYEK